MSGLLYFVPDARGAKAQAFLKERFGVGGPERWTEDGPSGGGGTTLVLAGESAPRCGFYPDAQTWHQAPGADWWIGIDTERPPVPADLARPDVLGGHPVRLEDGNEWLIPPARVWIDGDDPGWTSPMPKRMGMGPDGKLALQPLPRFAWYGEAADEFYHAYYQPDENGRVMWDFERGWKLACHGLQFNYYLSGEEISVLGLLTTANIWEILKVIIDAAGFERVSAALADAAQKKTTAGTGDGSDTASGVTDSPPATDPHTST